MLFHCRKKSQTEDIYKVFKSKFSGDIRDLRQKDSGPRYLELVFRTDNHKPFIDFSIEMLKTAEGIKHDIEFAYDDGTFHMLHIDSDGVSEDPDRDYSSEWVYLSELTGIKDNNSKAIQEWAKELNATNEEILKKEERIDHGNQAWDRQIERSLKKMDARKPKRKVENVDIEVSSERQKVKYSLPPNLSKTKVLEIIQKLNSSGEVIIPVFIFKDEIDKRMKKDDMLQLFLDIDRSEYKSEMFGILKKAVNEFQKK